MKARTRILNAVQEMYAAYAEYSLKVLNIPVVPKYPQITWKAGNTPEGAHGSWVIDGKSYPGDSLLIAAYFQERTVYWEEKTKRKSEPAPKDRHEAR